MKRPPHAFVGTRGANATEYHDSDFDWEILLDDGRAAVRRQRLEREGLSRDDDNEGPHGNLGRQEGDRECDRGRGRREENTPESESLDWEDFHAQHSLGRFFKEKRYLPIEFPQLRTPDITIGEIGCGCGSALIPVLRDNPTAMAVACDVSPTAISVFSEAAMPGAGIDGSRVRLSVNDFPTTSPFQDESIDIAMIIFTLSAFHPRDMADVVETVKRSLRPGGLVLLRDYGLYDMAQVCLDHSRSFTLIHAHSPSSLLPPPSLTINCCIVAPLPWQPACRP